MFKRLIGIIFLCLCCQTKLIGHCQMPCGIYHDDIVFDQVDQFLETMVKGLDVLKENAFSNSAERNTYIRWVMQKEKQVDEMTLLITTYFIQQKLKAGEKDIDKKLASAHLLLLDLLKIKQTVDIKAVDDFYQEWERFKLFFKPDGYQSRVALPQLPSWVEKHQDHPH